MNEAEIREKVVAVFRSWIGRNEADGTHRQIIDIYNTIKPLPAGYAVKYTDSWCAAAVSAAAQVCGLTDIIFPECSCSRMIALYQKAGRWKEDDSYIPAPGDLIMYGWADSGKGDYTGAPDHVGMVERCDGKTIVVIEGNRSDQVMRRIIAVNARYIRGFCLPDYASKATGAAPAVDWAGDAKQWAISNGLIKGTGTGADGKTEYSWDSGMTRAQLATVLYRFAKLIGKA